MKEFLKKLKGYKSVAFFVLAFLVAVAGIADLDDLKLPTDQTELLALLVPLAGIFLRWLTNTPVFESEPLEKEEFDELMSKRHNL